MIFDAFLYAGEKACLDIRIAELSGLDVMHIAVQANKTFTNKPKSFVDLNYDRVASVNVTDMPDGDDPWGREKWQRNSIMRGLETAGAKDDDLIVIADADEIPKAEAIKKYHPGMAVTSLVMDKFGYWLNCVEGFQSWKIAKILTYWKLKNSTPDLIRNSGQENYIYDAGWHYSWLGDVNNVVNKFNSFSHQECNKPELNNVEVLKYKIATGQSLWGEDFWQIIPIDGRAPSEVRNNIEKYKHLIHADTK
jgi:beta-1,4-mannosyl-glycoprotein beta-1,4-N-acetylglucosaminyltransferase